MAEERVTPEKQLLRLIEESKSGSKKEAEKTSVLKRKGLGLLSIRSVAGAIVGRLSFFKRSTKKKVAKAKKFSFSVQLVNKALVAVVVAGGIYLISDVTVSAFNMRKPPHFAFQKDQAAPRVGGDVSPFLKNSAYYLDRVSSRDIFKAWEPRPAKTTTKVQNAPVAIEESPFADLSLVGISWSANPEIIVEDKKRKKTYFLRKGQTFGDDMRVENIFKNKVILSRNGEEAELK